MKASDVFIRCLENEGVKYIFGIPGEENEDIMMSLIDSSIKFIPTRHEQGAAFMADVYGRLTGKAGVCLGTLGPGATNLITGVADANLDRAPLVAITGQSTLNKQHKESHQYVDIVQAFKPITKWNAKVVDPDTIPEIIRKAFRVAEREKPGATHIELPEDVAKKSTENSPLRAHPNIYPVPKNVHFEEAVKMIIHAKSPLILAGNGVIRTRSHQELIAFAEKNNIPVTNTFMGKGAMPSDHPLNLSTVGLQARDYVMVNFDSADLIITIGYDIVEYAPSFWNTAKMGNIIHIDTLESEVDGFYNPKLELIGDIKEILHTLTEMTTQRASIPFRRKLREYLASEFEAVKDDESIPMKPQKILYDLRKALPRDAIVISDVGAHKIWIARMFHALEPNTVIISNGFASMGIALPGAVSAKLANPNKVVVAATGDGGFLMNCQELETAKRLGVAFIVLVFNDQKYGMIEWKQLNHHKKSFGIDFTNPDFMKFAESFGMKGYRVSKAKDFSTILKKAIAANELALIDVPTDAKENVKLTQKLGENLVKT